MPLEFQQPSYLLLMLPLAAVLWWWHHRSLVDFSRPQRLASLFLRAAICLFVLSSLAGLTWLQSSAEPFVVLLVDRSASVGPAGREAGLEFLQKTEQSRGTRRGVIVPFASNLQPPVASVEEMARLWSENSPAPEASQASPSVAPELMASDPASAVTAAAAFVPAGFIPRVVLLTDGNETTGDLFTSATSAGVPVWTVPLPGRDDPEVQVSEVIVPAEVREGEPFVVEVVVSSNHSDDALVEVFRGGFRVLGERRTIVPGENRFRFEQTVDRDRLAVFRADFRTQQRHPARQ